MVNTTGQGEQFPPQRTGTIRAKSIDVSTEIPNAQAIPTSGSMALHNSTTMPIMSGAADTPTISTTSIRISRRVTEDYERWQRIKTERNWRKESQLQKVYPTPGESLLGFIVQCYKYETECLMCPRRGAVYNRELAEAFERIPYDQGWDGHGGNPNMYSLDKRGAPRRPDSPHPRAKRVMFKLPAEDWCITKCSSEFGKPSVGSDFIVSSRLKYHDYHVHCRFMVNVLDAQNSRLSIGPSCLSIWLGAAGPKCKTYKNVFDADAGFVPAGWIKIKGQCVNWFLHVVVAALWQDHDYYKKLKVMVFSCDLTTKPEHPWPMQV
ncbi:hypothetical protein KIW84_064460 [Lathyrus oleraceus]|uniref:Uncharacterized protein n=1 Tax=Pisum sativum TaxID=3888 RepID=A0A9D4WCN9_PEA|nr:hypothetical protein KIW84_064460 [Pisum sativum]